MSASQWVAQPRQNLFLHTHADVFEAGYGGAAGGGKTDALLIYQLIRRTVYPGSRGLFLRRRHVDLMQPGAALDRFRELFCNQDFGVTYNANEKAAYWPNGSVTKFGYMDTDADRHQYQGSQFDDVSFDEATQFSKLQYTYLFSRIRVTKPELAAMGMITQVRCAANPGGVGHAWFKKRFVDACRDTVIADEETGRTRVFVPSKVDDNYSLLETDPFYKQALMTLPEKERRALLDGDWDIYEGQVFGEWRRDVHVCAPVTPPGHWRRFMGFDWGYTAPSVVGWFARDPDTGQVVLYRELAIKKAHDREIATRILTLSRGETIDYMAADPSIWTAKNGTSTADVLGATPGWTIPLIPADNDRMNGVRRVHEYLGWQPGPDGGVATSPLLRVGANCTYTIASLPMLIHSETKPEDVDTKGDDHAYDMLRYALMTQPVSYISDAQYGTILVLSGDR